MEYKLSIIIPTKNRQEYCEKVIEQILSLNLCGVQLVIQDNSDDGSILKGKIDALSHADVLYNYHAGELSFVDNFSEAVSLASGEYLCMIGDDDGVLPTIMPVLDMAIKGGYDAVIPGLNAVYSWPMENPFFKGAEKGYLCLSYIKNKQQNVDCKKGLKGLLATGGQRYQELDIPRIYHGLVKRSCVEKIKEKTGHYFGGLTPDIYVAAALCFTCEKVCRLSYPVTVSGICPRSGSSDSATGKHTGKLADAPHFRGHESYEWDKKIPYIYTVESIWAETTVKALLDFDAAEAYEQFSVAALDALCLCKYPQFKEELCAHAKEHGLNPRKLALKGKRDKRAAFIKRVVRRLFRKKGEVKKYYEVTDISLAATITEREIKACENS